MINVYFLPSVNPSSPSALLFWICLFIHTKWPHSWNRISVDLEIFALAFLYYWFSYCPRYDEVNCTPPFVSLCAYSYMADLWPLCLHKLFVFHVTFSRVPRNCTSVLIPSQTFTVLCIDQHVTVLPVALNTCTSTIWICMHDY